ncbi:WHG domain-containing protein [Actinosynnema pretiosum subsp. pretiosum]|uniref:Transcriptional regulator, TetR family n=2 Tax=Actinosynnema TaxID=40566 RepID=C6WLQ6_ACTMD|nr:TetR/AcrR family transcriptional regulator [Actinosynnema mirum]ACU40291.1 transcriptional regulator, TetR family [Actinosynnema mirum DSM 43827]AXX33804.1 Transcriptional regulator, TetR family [Actinosynnema pretiosum subsp. pretiosum]QUF02432.1 WHG domain-containing protein [Actinosynnema pretiosum subsp. pretiosum]
MVQARRERYRAETREEAKRIALEQLAALGVEGVSVNAIAKRMGITGPALYRYFSSREDLLTDLIRDAYADVAALADAAVAATVELGGAARFRHFAGELRGWALAQPHRYLLLYGTPVPGYRAPEDTLVTAHRAMSAFLLVFRQVHGERSVKNVGGATVGRVRADEVNGAGGAGGESELDVQLAGWVAARGGGEMPSSVPLTALRAWTRLHGVLSLEVSGQFGAMGFDPALLYGAEVESLVSGG